MDIRESIELSEFPPDIERLRGELEQARVALEDLERSVVDLTAANARLQVELQRETECRQALERQLEQLRAAKLGSGAPVSLELALRQQLSTALEEMHVMAEELTLAQEALLKASSQ